MSKQQIAVIQDTVLATRGVLPSGLDATTRETVLGLAALIRNSHQQAAQQVAKAGLMLVDLKNLINDDQAFKTFCEGAFDWATPTTYRYLKIGAAVKAHFVGENDLINPAVSNMASNIFLMLGADTDRAVIDKLLDAASNGHVTEVAAKRLLSEAAGQYDEQARASAARISDLTATVANRDATISELSRELEGAVARGDRAEIQLTQRERSYADLKDELNALLEDKTRVDDELTALRSTPAQVVYEPKEVPPEGYTNAQAAIADAEARAAALQKEIEAISQRITEQQAVLGDLDAQVTARRDAQEVIRKLRVGINDIIAQTPAAIAAAQQSPAAMEDVKLLAADLGAMVEVLNKTTAAMYA
ncbi:hypothetical protein [Paraburkholderia youngii]|uniref:hypothetical protein n=1 Tax=Paraburkholderia youngii TaxID=2782701 RepID=UPI003D25B643